MNSASDAAVAAASSNRGFEWIQDRIEIRVIWLSTDPCDPLQPDIDNMLKPLIDTLNKKIIADDRQVHRILAEKGDINFPPLTIQNVYPEIQDDPEYTQTGEVIVVRISKFALEYQR